MEADYLFFVSPHHAPVPARLCMFLEKVERLAFLYRPPEPSCQPELSEKARQELHAIRDSMLEHLDHAVSGITAAMAWQEDLEPTESPSSAPALTM